MSVNPLTIVTRIKPAEFDKLEKLLAGIGSNLENSEYLRFSRVRSLHTAAFVVVEGDAEYPPVLVLDTNYDGDLDEHIDELIAELSPGLDAIYGLCEGYPDNHASRPDAFRKYLKEHAIPASAYFAAFRDHGVASIKNAVAVREQVERFIDDQQRQGALRGLSATEICDRIRQHLASDSTAVKPMRSTVTIEQQQQTATLNSWLLGAGLAGVVMTFWPLIALWLIAIRIREISEAGTPTPPPPKVDERIFSTEDLAIQNNLASVGIVKPGLLAQWMTRFALGAIDLLWNRIFRMGSFGNVFTMHFARAVMLDGGKRMMLLTCYDNSFMNYLSEFADKAAYYLNAVYSNVEGYPACRWLVLDGTAELQTYANWTRQHMKYTPVFYSAYSNETVRSLLKDVTIRDLLAGPAGAAQAEALLKLL